MMAQIEAQDGNPQKAEKYLQEAKKSAPKAKIDYDYEEKVQMIRQIMADKETKDRSKDRDI